MTSMRTPTADTPRARVGFAWQSLQTRVTLLTLGIFLLSVWSLALFASHILRQDMQRVLGEQQFSAASFAAAKINRDIEDRLASLKQAASGISAATLNNPAALQSLLAQRPGLPVWFNGGFFVTRTDAVAIAEVPLSAGRIGISYADNEAFRHVLRTGQPIVGRPVVGKKLQMPVFPMIVPILDSNGQVIGALNGVTNLGQPSFLDEVSDGRYGKTGSYLLIAPTHGLIVTGSDKARVMQPMPAPGVNAMHDRYMQGYEGYGLATNSRGIEELSAAKRIAAADWLLVAVLPSAEAFAPIATVQQRLLLATLLLTLLSSALTWWVIRRLLRHQLAPALNASRALSTQTDTETLLLSLVPTRPEVRQDEIGELIAAFYDQLTVLGQRETALRESEARFRALSEASFGGICIHDQGVILECNLGLSELTGFSQQELVGMNGFALIAPESLETVLANVRRDHTDSYEVLGVRKDGSRYDLAIRGKGISHHGKPVRVIEFRDITLRKQGEEALRKSNAVHGKMIANIGDVIVIIDQQGVNRYKSPNVEKWFGWKPEHLVGQSTWANIHPDDLASMQKALGTLSTQANAAITTQCRYRCQDGSYKWIEVTIVNLLDDPDIQGFLGNYHDITERKRSDLALENFFAQPAGLNLIAKLDGTVVQINQGWQHLLGHPAASLAGSNFMDLVHPDDQAATLSQLALLGHGQASLSFENRCRRLDGSYCLLAWSATASVTEQMIYATATDITAQRQAELALRDSETRWLFALQGSGDGVWDWDLQAQTAFFSSRWKEMLGYDEADISNSPTEWVKRVHPDDLNGVMTLLQAHLDGKTTSATVENRLLCKDGRWKWITGRGMVVERDADGKPLRVVGTNTDITERKLAEQKLQLAASVFTHAREGILITDATATIVEVNETFTRITGYSRQEALGQNPRMLKSERQPPEFYTAMWQGLLEKGHWYGEVWNRRKDGDLYAEMLTISAVRDAAGAPQHYVALFTDITLMKEQQQRLEHIAHFDALTNLPNRVLLADRLQQAMLQSQRRAKTLAVAYLDLDGFKQVNDQHGHDVGDTLLIAVSQHIKQALREGDSLARIGGDEFVAVLVDLEGARDCEPVLTRLLQAAAKPVTTRVAAGQTQLQVSASIGVTLYPQDGVDADLLLRHADQAMYQAKDAGKNRFHFYDMDTAVAAQTQRQSLQSLSLALAQQQFVLYYQPKVNMRSGAVVGAEALIRWQHPQRGLLPPGAFLSVIDNHPLGIAVGEWVIDTALAQMAAWHAQGLSLPVSVNIGAPQLQQAGFAARLGALLDTHPDVQPHCLQLEVLETSALYDMTHVAAAMMACQGLGVSFALDDFGTGYSSLTYLRHLPAQTLKIDQSFVRDMLVDLGDMAIVQGVIGLAQTFGRSVIAEGVETAAHGARLLELQCELAQGYGIARPMPAHELPQWVQQWHRQAKWSA